MSNVVFLRPHASIADEPLLNIDVTVRKPITRYDWTCVAIWVGIITLSPLALVTFAVGVVTILQNIAQ